MRDCCGVALNEEFLSLLFCIFCGFLCKFFGTKDATLQRQPVHALELDESRRKLVDLSLIFFAFRRLHRS